MLPSAPISPVVTSQADELGIRDYDYAKSADSMLAMDGWSNTMDDNFDISPMDTAKSNWRFWIGGGFNNELQLYTNSPNNLTLIQDPTNSANKLLLIRAKKEKVRGPKYRPDVDNTIKDFDFTSARIESKTVFSPNRTKGQVRIAARIKLPTGYGMWPSFWSYGEKWPTNGGIAIVQSRGQQAYAFQNAYFYDNEQSRRLVPREEKYIISTTNLTDRWHVYEVIWQKDSLTFLLDGQIIDIKQGNYVEKLFEKPQRISLNQAVGGDFFSIEDTLPTADEIPLNENEGVMQVDWIKVYLKK
ncbi:glycoside hydrolase family 16 protein [Spirosoma sp.]|uniref:glycoside hydrolase family 16 protein n=1 Tax=Spirosoma sp. TaxID=1899569 RepID=UPI0026044384|nr:glycoside hydrolase family 16 protein [Spirosoma sp.]MCX6214643.1 glycoside hydrolase family 16 protein [Spirosoma sp.]